jgi:hypothetical protein
MSYRLHPSGLPAFAAVVATGLGLTSTHAQTLEPDLVNWHVGVDKAENVGFGTYSGLPNPNYDRLVFLLSHVFPENPLVNHFHRIGAYSYTGPVDNPEFAFSGNNRVPEPYQSDDGLALLPGSGTFDGKLVSGLGFNHYPLGTEQSDIEREYSDLTVKPLDALLAFDGVDDGDQLSPEMHPGHHLVNASRGAYKTSVADRTIGLKLVDHTDGLSITDETGTPLFNALDDTITLGSGDDWSFNPVFSVDGSTSVGETFGATFVLIDQTTGGTPYGDSAPFGFDFVAVPEPATATLALAGLMATQLRRRRA